MGEDDCVWKCSLFSLVLARRNAEDNTGKYPDIVARLPGLLQPHVQSIVFDSEAVAWDNEKKKIQPFQVRIFVCSWGHTRHGLWPCLKHARTGSIAYGTPGQSAG